jgi:hypothetical protein
MSTNDRVDAMFRAACEEGLRAIEKVINVDPITDEAARKAERRAFIHWIRENVSTDVPSKLSEAEEVKPKQVPSLVADDIAKIVRELGFTCHVMKGEKSFERFVFVLDRVSKKPVIMIHVDLEKREDDLQKYVFLTIKIQDFRYKKRSVVFSEDVLRSVLFRELYAMFPGIDVTDHREFPLVCTHITCDTYKYHKFEAFHIVLFLRCGPPVREVYFRNLDVVISTICLMMFNVLPGFKGSLEPDGPRTYGSTTKSFGINDVERMVIHDPPVVIGVPFHGVPSVAPIVVVAVPFLDSSSVDPLVVAAKPVDGYPGDDISVVEAMPCEP